MRQLLCLLAFVVALSACKKNDTSDSQATSHELAGRYGGTFNRSGMDTVDVNFLFTVDNDFSGSAAAANYPAICKGSFQRNGDVLTVDNTCAWTADFDWTLIFDGNYNISFTGENTVRIWRTNGAITDEYLLGRLIR